VKEILADLEAWRARGDKITVAEHIHVEIEKHRGVAAKRTKEEGLRLD
jgi:hypothetical protein